MDKNPPFCESSFIHLQKESNRAYSAELASYSVMKARHPAYLLGNKQQVLNKCLLPPFLLFAIDNLCWGGCITRLWLIEKQVWLKVNITNRRIALCVCAHLNACVYVFKGIQLSENKSWWKREMKNIYAWMKEKWKDDIMGVLYKFLGLIETLMCCSLNVVYRPIERKQELLPILGSSVLQIPVEI